MIRVSSFGRSAPKRTTVFASILMLLFFCWSALSAQAASLTVAIGIAPSSFVLRSNCSNILFALAYDPLIRIGADGSYVPGIAESWEYSDNNTAFTLKIRKGVKFQDGTDLTPQSVVDTLVYNRDNPGINQGYLKPFKTIEVVNGDSVRIKYDRPFRGMETLLSADGECNNGLIISAAGLASPDRMSSEFFGSGAYVLDRAKTVKGDRYVYARNPTYWDPERQKWDQIVVRVIGSPTTAFQALRNREVQVSIQPLDRVAQAQLLDQAKASGFLVAEAFKMGYGINIFDRNGEIVPALKDQRVRQAMNYAVDREALLGVLGPAWTPLGQFGIPGLMGYVPELDRRYPYDLRKAKALLAEAGYPKGFSMHILDLSMANPNQAMASMLDEAGIHVQMDTLPDPNSWYGQVASKKFPAMAPSFLLLGDVQFDAVRLLIPPYYGPWSPFQTQDPDLDAAYEATAAAKTDAEFVRLNEQLNRLVTEKAWFVPLAAVSVYTYAQGIKDLGKASPIGQFNYLLWEPAN